jgi:hypothetical protein
VLALLVKGDGSLVASGSSEIALLFGNSWVWIDRVDKQEKTAVTLRRKWRFL